MAVFIRLSGNFELKWPHLNLVVVILIVGNPFQKTIATCNLRILINIIWLNRHPHSHTYIYNTQIVAVRIEISFVWGLGKFTLICRSPNNSFKQNAKSEYGFPLSNYKKYWEMWYQFSADINSSEIVNLQ